MQVWVCNNWSRALLEVATMGFNTSNNELKRDRRAPMIGVRERVIVEVGERPGSMRLWLPCSLLWSHRRCHRHADIDPRLSTRYRSPVISPRDRRSSLPPHPLLFFNPLHNSISLKALRNSLFAIFRIECFAKGIKLSELSFRANGWGFSFNEVGLFVGFCDFELFS